MKYYEGKTLNAKKLPKQKMETKIDDATTTTYPVCTQVKGSTLTINECPLGKSPMVQFHPQIWVPVPVTKVDEKVGGRVVVCTGGGNLGAGSNGAEEGKGKNSKSSKGTVKDTRPGRGKGKMGLKQSQQQQLMRGRVWR